jgi:two-component system, chemotaxis family, chemotaxis protein CheY
MKPKKILIVDDNETDRMILRKVLEKLGYSEVHESIDGQDADYKIDTANQLRDKFDIAFIDWKMPRLNGLKLVKSLRATHKNSDLVIIMTTGVSESDSVMDAAQAGVNDYILKPVTTDVLREKLAKHVK